MRGYAKIDHESEVPKYKQVEDLIITDIEAGLFKQGQRIPSINETSEELLLSRDTVEKAYVSLRKRGIISSVKGKGYYVRKTDMGNKLKIALIFNKLSNYKRSLYHAFVGTLGNRASVDVFIYNYDLAEFKAIIDNHLGSYDYFVILPHFRNENADVESVIRKIPRDKVLLVDRNLPELKEYPVVYQEYDNDIREALTQALPLLGKYHRLNLIFPQHDYYSPSITRGFDVFCISNGFERRLLSRPEEETICAGEVYITVSDNDLYELIKIIQQRRWKPGRDIGIISYNENPVKELLCDGISTISTNHDETGRLTAEMILKKSFKRVKCTFRFLQRNSL